MIRRATRCGMRLALQASALVAIAPAAFAQTAPFDMSPESGAAPFAITDSDVIVYSGTENAGDAQITRNEGQSVSFQDSASAGDAQIITNSGGSAQFSGASTAGSAALTNNGTTAFVDTATAGDATIVNNGAGTLTFDNGASAGSAVIANSGFAAFRGNATAGNAVITNNQTGRIEFDGAAVAGENLLDNSGVVAFMGSSTASGRSITNNASGSIALSGNSNAGAAFIANNGALTATDTASLAGATITNNASGSIALSGNASAGTADITNGGTLAFSGSATAADALIQTQTGGRTSFAGNASGGAAEMRLDDGAILDISALANGGTSFGSLLGTGQIFLGANRVTVGSNGLDTTVGGFADGGVAGGVGGSLQKVGPGTLRLLGVNLYTGPTIVAAGTLQAANAGAFAPLSDVTVAPGALLDIAGFDQTIGSLAGGGQVDLAANILTLGGSNASSVFSGLFTGAGGIVKIGTGTFVIAGDSAIFGPTRVAAGILQLDGALPLSALTVEGGAGLTGTGTAGPITLLSGAFVAPGPGIGTLSVAGDLTLSPGSVYLVETTGSAADSLAVTGAASIDGAGLRITQFGLYTPGPATAILSADGGLTGTFGTVQSDYAFLDPVLAYTGTTALLGLTRNSLPFAAVGATFNQRNAGAGLDSAPAANLAQRAVLSGNADNARQAFDLLSGEVHASLRTELMETNRMLQQGMLARAQRMEPGLAAPLQGEATRVHDLGAWAAGFGDGGTRAGDGNAAEGDVRKGGVMAGLDAAIGERAFLGAAALYGRSSFDVAARGSTADTDSLLLGLYGGAQWNGFRLSAGGTYGWHSVATQRSIAFPLFGDTLNADYDASTASAFAELAYALPVSIMLLEPFVGVTHVMVDTDAFAESGGDAALSVASGRENVTFSSLGARLRAPLGRLAGEVYAEAAWNHAFGDSVPAAQLAFLGGLPFEAQGTPVGEDSVSLKAGIAVDITRSLRFGVSYFGSLGDGVDRHGGMVDASYRF
ncbi:autotransporter outer membrane beta-barrel domain-containing protein [Aureimonas frigidaquae]|uniref:autotransporter outer membrane beta-barrel domain-containing protein n=1 Tax=Aureimonas frigidaquae TaxID=424757 RepID=UPI000A9C6DCA|nr:autotransporter domain-containing protein [Aureimonas frigidaquae]